MKATDLIAYVLGALLVGYVATITRNVWVSGGLTAWYILSLLATTTFRKGAEHD